MLHGTAAPQAVTQKVPSHWFALFAIAWLAIWTAQLTPLQLLLPLQLDTSQQAGNWITGVVSSGLVLGIGGLAGVLAGPITGTISDRMRGSRPRRRPFALLGVWLTAGCLLLTGAGQSVLAIGAAWVGVSVGIAVAAAALTAMIADQLPSQQRGAAAAAASSAQAVGIVVGVGTVVLLGLSIFDSYLALALSVAVLGSLTAMLLPDPSGARPQIPRARPTGTSRFAWLHDQNFRRLLVGRLVVNIGNALGTGLFLFFLLHGLGQAPAQAEANLLLLIVVYTVCVVAAAVGTGVVSDRIGHRRRLTVAAALVQASSGLVLVSSATFSATMVAAALMGVGYGAFMTVGLAFAADLLPSERDHGRDLGVVHVSAALGQLLGPLIGAGLVALVGGFWLVFLAATALSALGAGLTALARER